MFPPAVTVSGLSVLYLKVKEGTFNVIASSWRPPESVKIKLDLDVKTKNPSILMVLQCEHVLSYLIHQISQNSLKSF